MNFFCTRIERKFLWVLKYNFLTFMVCLWQFLFLLSRALSRVISNKWQDHSFNASFYNFPPSDIFKIATGSVIVLFYANSVFGRDTLVSFKLGLLLYDCKFIGFVNFEKLSENCAVGRPESINNWKWSSTVLIHFVHFRAP